MPINKPHGLNIGLRQATKDVVTIFDAEDEIHPDILHIVNTTLQRSDVEVVQSGVQLMNYQTNWYSLFNVLEYFFWFKSSLHFFAKQKLIPLGGNTVFFKRSWLDDAGGWDATCLTEDADIGIRLSLMGARTRVIYDEIHVTKEETPPTVGQLIKQRTRWNQGFIQIFLKGDWFRLPTISQRFLAVYVLTWPFVQGLLFMTIPVAIYLAFFLKMPALLGIYTNIPLYIFFMFLIMNNIGIYEFTKQYKFNYSLRFIPLTIIFFFPYQLILGISSFRAVLRQFAGNTAWEKTLKLNTHRTTSGLITNK